MALNVQVGHITQPGATGQQTYSLPAGFDPVALILVAVPVTADGVVAHASLAVGFASDRGGTAANRYVSVFAEDNAATSDTYRGQQVDAVIRLLDAAGAVDLEVDFVEFTSGASSAFVLDWVNLHTTASIRLHYIVFGGDDVVDAEAHTVTLTTGAGAQDITLGSGFGHPDVVFFARMANATMNSDAGADIGFGWGIRGGDDRSVWWGSADNAATEASFQRIDNNSALVAGAGATIETDIALGAEAGWPTDGYEISKTTSSFAAEATMALAIRFSGDVTITSGEGSARTTTGDTDLAVGTSTPKGLLLAHTRQTTANSTDTTSSDAAELGLGLVDGAGNERWAGIWDDDGQAAASVASSAQVDDKALRVYTPSSDALDGEADCTVVGSNFRLTTTDAFSSAWLFEWIAFGEAGGGGPQTIAVNQAIETDTALAITPRKSKAIAQATETDTATVVGRSKTRALGQATEADTATTLARQKAELLGQALETDTATALGKAKAKAIGQASETDTAGLLTRLKAKLLGQALEADTAQPITTSGAQTIQVGQAVETDTAQPIGKAKAKAIAQATETDTAGLLTRVKGRILGQATETDTATALGKAKAKAIGQALETNIAQAITALGGLIVATLLRLRSWDHRAVASRPHDHRAVSSDPHDHPAASSDPTDH